MYWRLAWRDIRKRPGRAALTLLSIVIGVASVVAVTFATQTTRRAFDNIFQTVAGRAALEVSAPVGASFDQDVLATVRGTPGVAAAVPLIQRQSVMFVGQRRINLVVLGIDPAVDAAVHDFHVTAGESLDKAAGVELEANLANSLGLQAGDQVELLTPRGIMKTRVVGLYTSGGTALTGQGGVALVQLRAAQYLFEAPKKIDSVQIVLQPAADEPAVRAAIAQQLPQGLTVHLPATRSPLAAETSLSTEQGMRMARAFSLLVAVFIIANTFLIGVTQRRRQLGIMRAIGATQRQVALAVYSEALLLGAVGTVLGAALGVVAAHYLTEAMGTLYQTTLPPIHLTALPLVLGAAFGLGISLLGAAIPARKASHLSPLEAMRDVLPDEIEGVSRWLVLVGGALVVACAGVMIAGITGHATPVDAVWGAVLLLIGLALLLPVVLDPLTAAAAAVLRPWLRVESRLAQRQLVRHRARTTLTIGVVFVAVSTGVGLASAVVDNVSNVRNWYHRSIVADFFVRAMAPSLSTGLAADVPDEVGAEIRKVPGIRSTETMRFAQARAAGLPVILIARSFPTGAVPDFDLESGDPQTLLQQLRDGQVVLGSVLAERAGLKRGDAVSLETDQGTQEFQVAAVANDYYSGGLTMYIDPRVAKSRLGIGGVDAYLVKADHAQLAAVRTKLQKIAGQHGLLVQSFSDIQQKIDRMMAGVVASLWAMVVLGLLVAAFGVANTLMMSVLEQTHELGLLRVLAMTRAQVRKLIFAQAVMMGLLALVPGIAAGAAVAYLINLATLPVTGHAVAFVIPPWLFSGGLVVGLAIIVAAAWLPAERAARLELPTAMRLR